MDAFLNVVLVLWSFMVVGWSQGVDECAIISSLKNSSTCPCGATNCRIMDNKCEMKCNSSYYEDPQIYSCNKQNQTDVIVCKSCDEICENCQLVKNNTCSCDSQHFKFENDSLSASISKVKYACVKQCPEHYTGLNSSGSCEKCSSYDSQCNTCTEIQSTASLPDECAKKCSIEGQRHIMCSVCSDLYLVDPECHCCVEKQWCNNIDCTKFIIIIAAVGSFIFIVIVIVLVCCVRKCAKKPKNEKKPLPTMQELDLKENRRNNHGTHEDDSHDDAASFENTQGPLLNSPRVNGSSNPGNGQNQEIYANTPDEIYVNESVETSVNSIHVPPRQPTKNVELPDYENENVITEIANSKKAKTGKQPPTPQGHTKPKTHKYVNQEAIEALEKNKSTENLSVPNNEPVYQNSLKHVLKKEVPPPAHCPDPAVPYYNMGSKTGIDYYNG